MAPDARGTAVATRGLCFAIGPYGEAKSDKRKWSDFLFETILEPVLGDDYTVQRTIDSPEAGKISARIERDLQSAPLVVADLTGANPNVYFEMGYRHALRRPMIYVARLGTELPFDVQDYSVVLVDADYVERPDGGYFTIQAEERRRAQDAVRQHLENLPDVEEPVAPPTVAGGLDPVSAKVYDWQVFYSSQIHVNWLATQSEPFREQVERYENGGGMAAVSEGHLPLVAEYLALKSAASLTGDGTIFLTLNNHTRKLDFGHAVFRFATSPDPVLIKVVSVGCGATGLEWIRFAQQSRPYPLERNGRPVTVTIPGYNYTLNVTPDPNAAGVALGEITHPHSRTKLGEVELRPRYGEHLR